MKTKTYKQKFEEYHKDDVWGRFLKWLENKKEKKSNEK